MNFEIKLPIFEGPFDLLLFFIEREELDIYDIPIAKITKDFLDYIHQLEQMNIEVASEFIYVAATLMRIKAQMLLPQTPQEPNAEGDPRKELVNALLEYQRYKSVLPMLEELELKQLHREKRGNILSEIMPLAESQQTEMEMYRLDMYKLLRVYEQVLQKYDLRQKQENAVHTIVPYPYTIESQKLYILKLLETKTEITFWEIIENIPLKIAIIYNFLAILELLQNQMIFLVLGNDYNDFLLKKYSAELELSLVD